MIGAPVERRGASDRTPGRVPAVLVGFALVVLGAAGCDAPGGGRLQVWVQDDVYGGPVLAGAAESAARYDARADRVTLAGAINETLSFCLAILAPDGGIDQPAVAAGELRGSEARIPPNAVRIYRVHEVAVDRWPGWHLRSVPPQERVDHVPDVLVPVDAPKGGLGAHLSGAEPVKLWVDVHIPKGTAPGTYFGGLEIRGGDQVLESVGLSVTVWPFVLPEPREVTLLSEIDHQRLFAHHVLVDGRPHAPLRQWGDTEAGAELDELLTATMRLLRSHKVTPLLPRLTPVAKVDAVGRLTVDWTDYDRVAGSFVDGGRFLDRHPLRLWRIPFHKEFPPPPVYGAMSSPTYAKLARQYLANCAEHFVGRGWLERSFVALPQVTGPGMEGYAAVRHFGRVVRGADRRLRTLAPLFPQDMSPYGWEGFAWQDVSSQVDIWAPPAQFFEPSAMQRQRMRQRRTFWSLDRPPFSGSIDLAARPADTRVIVWQARAYDVEAVLLGQANDWPAGDINPAAPQSCCRHSRAPLIYPGRFFGLAEPVPSARLKRLRRSMQDLAYLELCDQRGLAHISSVLVESLSPRAAGDAYGAHFGDGQVGGWSGDPGHWSVARRIMADEIIRSIGGGRYEPRPSASGSGESTQDVADAVQWRRFMEATRRVQIKVDGVRVQPVGPALGGAVEVAVFVTLVNRTRTPLSGGLAFEELPIAWRTPTPEVEVPEIGPQQSRRVTLRAIAGVMETDAGGTRYLPIILRTAAGRTYRFFARLSYLAATPSHDPLLIDGDLSDWPSAVGSLAEDFVLVTGESPEVPLLPSTRATQDTQCFVTADSEALYFAFNCAIRPTEELPRGQRNYVYYQDGVPIGEELVEILLDPTNAGTRSTSDLFHVVIKPNGWFCERGIGTDPPTGVRSPWAAGLSAAVQIHDDRWVAEVRIPRDAFGARTHGRQVWGVNLTRFDLARQEFSNWSGAAQNVYDPLSLGNLTLP